MRVYESTFYEKPDAKAPTMPVVSHEGGPTSTIPPSAHTLLSFPIKDLLYEARTSKLLIGSKH